MSWPVASRQVAAAGLLPDEDDAPRVVLILLTPAFFPRSNHRQIATLLFLLVVSGRRPVHDYSTSAKRNLRLRNGPLSPSISIKTQRVCACHTLHKSAYFGFQFCRARRNACSKDEFLSTTLQRNPLTIVAIA